MKRLFSLLSAATLIALAATAAKSQIGPRLTASLTAPVDLSGGVFQYGGSILNSGEQVDIQLDSATIGLPGGVTQSGDALNDTLSSINITLIPGGSFADANFFQLMVPAGFNGAGTFVVHGTVVASGQQVDSNTVDFPISRPRIGGQVPEPSAWAMLAIGGTSLSGFVLRSRSRLKG